VIRTFILVGVRLYREGLERFLQAQTSVQVIGSSARPSEAIDRIHDLRPDVVLVDLGMVDGRSAARRIREAASEARVVALAVSETGAEVVAWAEAGMAGYVSRDGSLDDLLVTIKRASRGETLCPPTIMASVIERLAAHANGPRPHPPGDRPRLTRREREIIGLIDQGLSNKEIARVLSIALPTVKNHVHNILEKVGARRRGEAVATFRQHRGEATGPA
jgi:two-component system, NarL family, nitrate/nitrite response regulator NarL